MLLFNRLPIGLSKAYLLGMLLLIPPEEKISSFLASAKRLGENGENDDETLSSKMDSNSIVVYSGIGNEAHRQLGETWSGCFSNEDAYAQGLSHRDQLAAKDCRAKGSLGTDGHWRDCGNWKFSLRCRPRPGNDWSYCYSDEVAQANGQANRDEMAKKWCRDNGFGGLEPGQWVDCGDWHFAWKCAPHYQKLPAHQPGWSPCFRNEDAHNEGLEYRDHLAGAWCIEQGHTNGVYLDQWQDCGSGRFSLKCRDPEPEPAPRKEGWTPCYSNEDANSRGLPDRDALMGSWCRQKGFAGVVPGHWEDCGNSKFAYECAPEPTGDWTPCYRNEDAGAMDLNNRDEAGAEWCAQRFKLPPINWAHCGDQYFKFQCGTLPTTYAFHKGGEGAGRYVINKGNGKYLSVENGMNANNGNRLMAKPHSKTDASQIFVKNVYSQLESANKCVDLYDGQCNAGNKIIVWDCDKNNQNQHWIFQEDGSITPNRCKNPNLVLAESADGSIILAGHEKTEMMKWRLPKVLSTVTMQHTASNKVLDIAGGKTSVDNHNEVIGFDQHCRSNQDWIVPTDGSIPGGVQIRSFVDPSKCLSLKVNNCISGSTEVVMYDCVDMNFHKWVIGQDGSIKNVGCNQYLALNGQNKAVLVNNVVPWKVQPSQKCPNKPFAADFCWRETHVRGGISLPTECPPDTDHDLLIACWSNIDQCPKGYYRSGLECHQYCPSGWTSFGLRCIKDKKTYSQKTYSGWPFNIDKQFEKCNSEQKPKCSRKGVTYEGCTTARDSFMGSKYLSPCCKDGYYADTRENYYKCIENNAKCADHGMDNLGFSSFFHKVTHVCSKKKMSPLSAKQCTKEQGEQSLGLCYSHPCAPGFEGFGPTCWAPAPKDTWVVCGMGAAKDEDTCKQMKEAQSESIKTFLERVTFVLELAVAITGKGRTNPSFLSDFNNMMNKYNGLKEIDTGHLDKLEKVAQTTVYVVENAPTWIDFASVSDKTTAADKIRITAQIIAVLDPLALSGIVSAFSYPMCDEIDDI